MVRQRLFRLPITAVATSERGYTIPAFHMMGNHDNDPFMSRATSRDRLSYRNTLGPNYYSFNLGAYTTWCSTTLTGSIRAARKASSEPATSTLVSLAQMEWLAEDLAAVEDKHGAAGHLSACPTSW